MLNYVKKMTVFSKETGCLSLMLPLYFASIFELQRHNCISQKKQHLVLDVRI